MNEELPPGVMPAAPTAGRLDERERILRATVAELRREVRQYERRANPSLKLAINELVWTHAPGSLTLDEAEQLAVEIHNLIERGPAARKA